MAAAIMLLTVTRPTTFQLHHESRPRLLNRHRSRLPSPPPHHPPHLLHLLPPPPPLPRPIRSSFFR
ncbi:hypothetical protein LINPERPRIM_LOCUS25172 [Linum perenne]